jgi:tetratricopeptide (TPR) repeat protein
MLGQLDKAVADLSQAIKLDPKSALAFYNRGLVHTKLFQFDEAVADCTKAVELAPWEGLYRHALGEAQYRADDHKAAVMSLTKSLESSQVKVAEVRFLLAMAHQKLGNVEDACSNYALAVEWLDKNQSELKRNRRREQILGLLRAETEKVLQAK